MTNDRGGPRSSVHSPCGSDMIEHITRITTGRFRITAFPLRFIQSVATQGAEQRVARPWFTPKSPDGNVGQHLYWQERLFQIEPTDAEFV